jgi:hypothetical protein
MGYGKFSQPGIPGGSTLIFEIELLAFDWLTLQNGFAFLRTHFCTAFAAL